METLHAACLRATAICCLIFTLLGGAALLMGWLRSPAVIAYISERSGAAQVYLLDVDHLLTFPVSASTAHNREPVWSRTGDLAFVRDHANGRDVVVQNPFTGQQCTISGRLLDESAPAWSSRGELAYVVGIAGRYDLYMQDGCRGDTARLLTRQSNFSVNRPNWSGAGWLAYDDDVHGTTQIAILDPQVGEPTIIPQPDGINYQAVWYEDRLLAFVSIRDGDADIYIYDLASGDVRNISNHPASDTQPAWSVDGRLAFSSTREGSGEIFVYDFADNTLVNVTRSPAHEIMPAWSGDGRLAFASAASSVFDIYVLDQVPGGVPRPVAAYPSQEYSPAWMP